MSDSGAASSEADIRFRPPTGVLPKALGPGLITGAADDDPSGIATYSQAGAQFGFEWAGPWCSLIR